MHQHGYDTLIVYADKEHGGNFEYLTGFIPRFEEALLVLHREGEAVLVLVMKTSSWRPLPGWKTGWSMRRGSRCRISQ